MQTPEIDVLIPVYNGARTIRESLESILRQTFRDINVHVVNDGSTDSTADILAELASADSRLKIYTRPNGGIVEALNFGLGFCRARYVARHDADDRAYPQRFQVQKQYLDEHPDCCAVGASVRHIDGDGKLTGSIAVPPPPSDCDPRSYPAREPYLLHPFLMARTEAVRAAGGYRYAHNCEDTDLYWRLQCLGRLHNLPDYLGEYRLHSESISGSSLNNGRLMAVFSQVAAVSEQRRRSGTQDFVLDKAMVVAAKTCSSLRELIDLCASSLRMSEKEARYLELAASAKLLELTNYRPYDVELSDCHTIGEAARRYSSDLDPRSRDSMRRQLSGTAANLAAKRSLLEAFKLLSPSYYAPFAYRLALRVLLPTSMRRRLRFIMRGAGPAK